MGKSRLYYQEKIMEALEDAENNLSLEEFDIFLKRIKEVLNEYE